MGRCQVRMLLIALVVAALAVALLAASRTVMASDRASPGASSTADETS